MKRTLLQYTAQANLADLSTARSRLNDAMVPANIAIDTRNKVLVCFSEIYTNCIEHAQAQNVQLTLQLQGQCLHLEMIDDGALNPQDHADKLIDDDPLAAFDEEQESGRGLAIVLQLSDAVSFRAYAEQIPGAHHRWNNIASLDWHDITRDHTTTIMLVEDDPALRFLYEEYLKEDYAVISCDNGASALKLLQNSTVDIIVSDINMPVMNGLDLRDALKKSKKTELIPFIFLSFEEDPLIINEARRSGVDDMIKKPCERESLNDIVERVLTRFQALSRRFSERIDERISSALQPQLPTELPHWHMEVRSRNTGAGGGDVMLHFQNAAHSYVIILDVMGHDETAKFFSYAYSGFIKGLMLGSHNTLSLDMLLNQLSNAIYHDALLSQLGLTCCALALGENGNINIACAGHPPPLKITVDDNDPRCEEVPVSGMMLGLLPNQTYHCHEILLQPTDRLAVFTDGLFESAQNASARKQLEGAVIDALASHGKKSIDAHANNVLSTFDERTKNHATDDALLILLETSDKH